MLTMFTALEARATAYLISPEDYSLYQHIETRILDTVRHGATHIIYCGKITHNVVDALRALGYEVTRLQYEGKEEMLRIDWTRIVCPKNIKELKDDG